MKRIRNFLSEVRVKLEIRTSIYIEDTDEFMPISQIDSIREFTMRKDDFLTDGFTNLDGKIVFEGNQIVDFDQSDEIDPLWNYYAQTLLESMESGFGEIYFPNAPIEVKFEKKGKHYLKLTVDDQSLTSEVTTFITAFCEAAGEFMTFRNIVTNGEYTDDLEANLQKLVQIRI